MSTIYILITKPCPGGINVFLDPLFLQYPDGIDQEKYVVATYYVASPRSVSPLKFAAALAVEQTTGT